MEVGGIFVDITKAFDSVDHEVLLNRLEDIGVRGISGNWLRTYLLNRFQCVRVKNVVSQPIQIKYGVPQGSVLGPILFLVYINDLCSGKFMGDLTCFADDTALCHHKNNSIILRQEMQTDLNKLKKWFTVNRMALSRY